jgi:hypothetical protein
MTGAQFEIRIDGTLYRDRKIMRWKPQGLSRAESAQQVEVKDLRSGEVTAVSLQTAVQVLTISWKAPTLSFPERGRF